MSFRRYNPDFNDKLPGLIIVGFLPATDKLTLRLVSPDFRLVVDGKIGGEQPFAKLTISIDANTGGLIDSRRDVAALARIGARASEFTVRFVHPPADCSDVENANESIDGYDQGARDVERDKPARRLPKSSTLPALASLSYSTTNSRGEPDASLTIQPAVALSHGGLSLRRTISSSVYSQASRQSPTEAIPSIPSSTGRISIIVPSATVHHIPSSPLRKPSHSRLRNLSLSSLTTSLAASLHSTKTPSLRSAIARHIPSRFRSADHHEQSQSGKSRPLSISGPVTLLPPPVQYAPLMLLDATLYRHPSGMSWQPSVVTWEPSSVSCQKSTVSRHPSTASRNTASIFRRSSTLFRQHSSSAFHRRHSATVPTLGQAPQASSAQQSTSAPRPPRPPRPRRPSRSTSPPKASSTADSPQQQPPTIFITPEAWTTVLQHLTSIHTLVLSLPPPPASGQRHPDIKINTTADVNDSLISRILTDSQASTATYGPSRQPRGQFGSQSTSQRANSNSNSTSTATFNRPFSSYQPTRQVSNRVSDRVIHTRTRTQPERQPQLQDPIIKPSPQPRMLPRTNRDSPPRTNRDSPPRTTTTGNLSRTTPLLALRVALEQSRHMPNHLTRLHLHPLHLPYLIHLRWGGGGAFNVDAPSMPPSMPSSMPSPMTESTQPVPSVLQMVQSLKLSPTIPPMQRIRGSSTPLYREDYHATNISAALQQGTNERRSHTDRAQFTASIGSSSGSSSNDTTTTITPQRQQEQQQQRVDDGANWTSGLFWSAIRQVSVEAMLPLSVVQAPQDGGFRFGEQRHFSMAAGAEQRQREYRRVMPAFNSGVGGRMMAGRVPLSLLSPTTMDDGDAGRDRQQGDEDAARQWQATACKLIHDYLASFASHGAIEQLRWAWVDENGRAERGGRRGVCVLALEEGRHEIAWGVQHSATVAVDDKGDNNKDVNKTQAEVIPPRIGSRKGFSAPGIRWPTLRRVELRNMEVDLGMVMRLMEGKASRLERVMVVGGLRRSESDEVERREWSRLERGLGVEIWKGWMGEDGEVVRQSWKSSGRGRDRGQRRGMKRGVVCHAFDRNVKIDTGIPTGDGEEKRAGEQVTKRWTSAEWRPGLRFEFIDSEDEDDRRKEIVGKGKEPRRVTKQVVIGRRAPIPDADDTAAVPSAEIEHEIREEQYKAMPRKGIYVVADDETIVEEDWETEREKSDCEE